MALDPRGVYTIPELSRVLGIPSDRARRWFLGKGQRGGKARVEPLFQPDHPAQNGRTYLSFFNLIDALVAKTFNARGVRVPVIRQVYNALRERLDHAHPFCAQGFFTDGAEIFEIIGSHSQGGARLTEVLRGQQFFLEVMRPTLAAIDYSEATRIAEQWRPAPNIILNPEINYGQPTVASCRVPALVLYDALVANDGDAEEVAEGYGVTTTELDCAVQFIEQLRARAA